MTGEVVAATRRDANTADLLLLSDSGLALLGTRGGGGRVRRARGLVAAARAPRAAAAQHDRGEQRAGAEQADADE
jgi:hypothetical protein